jgi:hypothetical protein
MTGTVVMAPPGHDAEAAVTANLTPMTDETDHDDVGKVLRRPRPCRIRPKACVTDKE